MKRFGKKALEVLSARDWPGNVRELEQALRRIMLTGTYEGAKPLDSQAEVSVHMKAGTMTAKELVQKYCSDLYTVHGNYGEVARRTGLDWRTVKKHVSSD